MNIKHRLKKLENEVIDDSTFCACYPQFSETYLQDLGEDAEHNEPVLTSDPVPDVCPNCRKPTEKKSIIIQLVDASTKDNFPDEWNKYRDLKGN